MTTTIKLLTPLLLGLLLVMNGCNKDDFRFGDILTPSKPVLDITITGKDATHPNGNGEGSIVVHVAADNTINYRIDFGDGKAAKTSTSPDFQYQYDHTGIKTLTVSVTAYGKAGNFSTNSEEITVFRAFEPDPSFVTMLTNNGTKKWRVDKDNPGHLGVSDAAVFTPAWWSAGPDEKAGLGIYDDVYTFNADGNVFTHETNNDIFGNKVFLRDFDPSLTGEGDFTLTGPKAAAYTETFGYDGGAGTEFITFSNKGHLGMYQGAHKYQVLERSATQMTLRCLQTPGAWYVKIIAIQ